MNHQLFKPIATEQSTTKLLKNVTYICLGIDTLIAVAILFLTSWLLQHLATDTQVQTTIHKNVVRAMDKREEVASIPVSPWQFESEHEHALWEALNDWAQQEKPVKGWCKISHTTAGWLGSCTGHSNPEATPPISPARFPDGVLSPPNTYAQNSNPVTTPKERTCTPASAAPFGRFESKSGTMHFDPKAENWGNGS